MADTVSTSTVINLVGSFQDGDDRTISFDDPVIDFEDESTYSDYAAQINAAGDYIKENRILIGDKTGADFVKFKSATIVDKTVTRLDLT